MMRLARRRLTMKALRYQAILAAAAAYLVGLPAAAQTTPTPPAAEDHEHSAPAGQQSPPVWKRTPAPADAYVYIGWPNNGAVIHSTRFKVWFGTRNFGVAPAETYVPNTGHHHLLIDVPLPPMDEPIPSDRHHLHFGRGQTEAILDLPPGTHTLQLLMGDGHHVPHDPPVMSKRITIHVVGKTTEVSKAD
jgi:hypothetical protein